MTGALCQKKSQLQIRTACIRLCRLRPVHQIACTADISQASSCNWDFEGCTKIFQKHLLIFEKNYLLHRSFRKSPFKRDIRLNIFKLKSSHVSRMYLSTSFGEFFCRFDLRQACMHWTCAHFRQFGEISRVQHKRERTRITSRKRTGRKVQILERITESHPVNFG